MCQALDPFEEVGGANVLFVAGLVDDGEQRMAALFRSMSRQHLRQRAVLQRLRPERKEKKEKRKKRKRKRKIRREKRRRQNKLLEK